MMRRTLLLAIVLLDSTRDQAMSMNVRGRGLTFRQMMNGETRLRSIVKGE